jgi:hypothetical protein
MAEVAATNALVILAEFPKVDQTLTLCEFMNLVHRAHLIELEGFETIDDFGDILDDAVKNVAKLNEARPQANRVPFGVHQILKNKAITFWVSKHRRAGQLVAVYGLNDAIVRALIREMNLASQETKRDDKLFYLTKFMPKKYILWA